MQQVVKCFDNDFFCSKPFATLYLYSNVQQVVKCFDSDFYCDHEYNSMDLDDPIFHLGNGYTEFECNSSYISCF